MKNSILLFPCIEKNIGDDLFIKILCSRYPNIEFEISDKARYGELQNIQNLHFSRRLKYFLLFTGRVPHNPVKKKVFAVLGACFRSGIGKHRAGIMIVGNAFKCYRYEGKEDSKWFEERMSLSEKFYLLSTNFGPYKDERWREDFRRLFSQCEDICFRDNRSFELFRDLPNVRFAPDAVFSLGRIKKGKQDRTIIISVINCALSGRPEWLLNCKETYEERLAETVELLVGKGWKVVLLNSNDNQDNEASERIKNKTAEKDRVEICHYDGDIETVLQLYKTASGVISTRLHTLILGLLSDLPVFPIVYDEKVEGILQTIDFTGCCANIRDMAKTSAESIVSALENYRYTLPDRITENANQQFAGIDAFLNH